MASVTHPEAPTTNGGTAQAAIAVENPATGQIIGTVPSLGAAEVAELVGRARAAQPGWEALSFQDRGG